MVYLEIKLAENRPYPNNSMPVRYYKNVIEESRIEAEQVLKWFKSRRYNNGWINGVYTSHHFHSNAHEVLACVSGWSRIQLGGPNSTIVDFKQGDVVFLPAGTAHKLLEASEDFKVVGAYPSRLDYDLHNGDGNYDEIKQRIRNLPKPELDPVTGGKF